LEYARRQSEIDYLKESVKLLRKFYKGFDAKAGYSLKPQNIVRLGDRKTDEIRELARQLRKEQASNYVIVRPKSKRSKEALYKHTGASVSKKRKAFVVHVPDDKRSTVKVELPKNKKKPARVVEVTKRTGAESKRKYFYFADYEDEPPMTIEEIIDITRAMLPDMPKGYYAFVSKDYGYIAAPMFRNLLIRELTSQWLDYDRIRPGAKDNRGLAESLVGYALVSTKLEGAEHEYNERQTRRAEYRAAKQREYQVKRARIAKRLNRRQRLTGRL
jgi:hypothetical protein